MNQLDPRSLLLLALGILGWQPPTGWAQEPTRDVLAAREVFFETHIRPALTLHCLECHSTDSETNGNLALDSRQGWETGGDYGPAIRPGDANESLLIKAVEYNDADLQMPPDGKLDDETIRLFYRWIEDGAFDPRESHSPPAKQPSGLPVERASEHWAYRPLVFADSNQTMEPDPTPSPAKSIDLFIQARLAANGLQPAPVAEPGPLLRRLSFDLTGLPPTPEQVAALEQDSSPQAWQQMIETMLASPGYAETFARHWMDVVRYAESITLRGPVLSQAWRYRDYLITSYAEDRPLDQMIREQIAGDLMVRDGRAAGRYQIDDLRERQLSCVATGFLAMGNANLEDQDKTKLEFDHIDEQLETIGRAFLAQTIGCARCHDHKFDPIPTADYYAMAAIMRSTRALKHENVSKWIESPLPVSESEDERYRELNSRLNSVSQRINELKNADRASEKQLSTARKQLDDLKSLQQELRAKLAERPMYLTIEEALPKDQIAIRMRGNVHSAGAMVRRGFLTAVFPATEWAQQIPDDSSGRMEMANWIADPRNPLTARVYVNRVWSWLMGDGLVATENNFGTTGQDPSHPQLLDWLAGAFMRSGWSTKQLVRRIVSSDAYRRRLVPADEIARDVDPRNRLYWSANLKRIPVESIRDAMLQISGELDGSVGGSTIPRGTKVDYGFEHQSNRRSVYQPVFRNALPQLFDVFDFANSSVSVGERSRRTDATQSLAMMNHPWIIQRSSVAAQRLWEQFAPSGQRDSSNRARLVDEIYLRCLSRLPDDREHQICLDYLGEELATEQLQQLVHAIFASIDFRYLE